MQKIFITRLIPEKAISMLGEHFSIRINKKKRQLTKEELVSRIKDTFGLLPLLTDRIDKKVIASAKQLKIIANYAVGFDNIDIQEATRRCIVVTNTPDVLTKTTAELAWALLFAAARRIAESDAFIRKGAFKGWEPTLLRGYDIGGKTLGIIGAGRIGTAFALGSRGFDMQVLYCDRQKNPVLERKLKAKKVGLRMLLQLSDFVSIHAPLTKETFHLIGKKEIASMKDTAILINTSRGTIVDEQALADALKKKTIAAAGLDVFEKEPYIVKKLTRCSNAVLTPHIGSATIETREKMAVMAAQSIIDVLYGKIPNNIVNRIRG